MNELFGPSYVEVYDLLYSDKDYAAECDLIERLFQTYGDGPIRSVLDLGCGTGNHAIPLAQRGYEVIGVDRSENMLARVRTKLADPSGNGRLVVQHGDIRSINLQRHFDAALMMFAVLGYQLENADVLSALGRARLHLRPGGLLLFDVWYGPAVLHQRPSKRIKVVPVPGGQTLRAASAELDTRHHLCTVHFHVRRLEGGELVAETEETHAVRYFYPLELNLFLESSGFSLLRLGAFPEFDKDPDDATWNVLGVARAT
jgi:SAM-dependent methyltransferase